MKKFVAIGLMAALSVAGASAQKKQVGWSAGYLPNYANFPVSKINWKCYTHLFWFSINPDHSGVVGGLDDNTAKNFTAACHKNNTKAIICIGGAGAANKFEKATANADTLNTFVNSAVSFMQRNGFDGIDVDWEDDGQGITASRYLALFKALNTALLKLSPKPLLTAAVADYYAAASAPVYPYCDMMNIMSYYDYASSCSQEIAPFTSRGVPKSKLGIGYGYDTDQEVDGPNECGNGSDGNPSDINDKIMFSINNGCGGIMVWEIDRAPAKCDSVTAFYVNKSATAIGCARAEVGPAAPSFVVKWEPGTVAGEIAYVVPGPAAAEGSLSLFDARGSLLATLTRGTMSPGTHRVSLRQTGIRVGAGNYFFRLKTGTATVAAGVVVPR
jgi:hypothetical protein